MAKRALSVRSSRRLADRLLPCLRVLVKRFRPLKVFLFGSYAYGTPSEDSDFDLLVIRREFVSEKASNLEIRRALRDVVGPRPSFTVITKSPEQLAERLAKGSQFYQDIVSRGLEIYSA